MHVRNEYLRKFKTNLIDYRNIIYFFINCAKENYWKEFRGNKTTDKLCRGIIIMDQIKIYIMQI